MDPSRGFVRAPGEAGDFDEGFDHDWRRLVTVVPVLRHLTPRLGEDVRSQFRDADPRQDQEPGVVDRIRQVSFPDLR